MYIVVIKPTDGNTGVFRFLKCIRRKWLFWSEPVFTLNSDEALQSDWYIDTLGLARYVSKKVGENWMACCTNGEQLAEMAKYRYYTIEVPCEHGNPSYYCGDDSEKVGRGIRRLPKFRKKIENAELFKSLDNANDTANRIRQTTKTRCTISDVYVNRINEYTLEKVIIALQNKQTKRLRYLKDYSCAGKASDRLQFVDSMATAMKVTIPQMMRILEDIHSKHKAFLASTHWYDGKDIPADRFRESKVGISMTLRIKDFLK